MMNGSPDVIVVGGGVIGCSIAFHLAKAGVKVALLERGQIGMEASNAASGVLSSPLFKSEDPYSRLTEESLNMLHQLAPELREICGVDIELVQCGEIGLAMTDREATEYQTLMKQVEAQSGNARWLGQQEVHEYEPELAQSVLGGFLMPDVCRVNNQRLSEAFAKASMRFGADVRTSVEVTGLVRSGLTIAGVRLHDEEMYADNVIVAAGPWSKAVVEWVGGEVHVRPVRGVNLNLQPVGRSIRSVIHGANGLLVPRNDGSIIAGVTIEEVGFDCRVTSGAIQDILVNATTLIPSLRDATMNWALAGLRPGSPDDAPLLGPVPGWDGLHIATGHYRNGILLSAITGKLITDHITGEEPELMTHFSSKRFSGG